MRLPGSASLIGDLRLTVPSSPSVLLALSLSLLLLVLLRVLILALSTRPPPPEKLASVEPVQHLRPQPSLSLSLATWRWRWEGLPVSSPVSLSPPPLDAPPSLVPAANVRVKSAGPAFDHPRMFNSHPVSLTPVLTGLARILIPSARAVRNGGSCVNGQNNHVSSCPSSLSLSISVFAAHSPPPLPQVIRKPTTPRRTPAPAARRLQSMV